MLAEPRCWARSCKHYLGVKQAGQDETGEVNYCTAFPSGIPQPIAYGDNLHLEPYPGDHGIQYESD
jgi:hypothetical protein